MKTKKVAKTKDEQKGEGEEMSEETKEEEEMSHEEKENKFSSYTDIIKLFKSVKIANLTNSLKYSAIQLEEIYKNKKEFVIEALVALIEQFAIEDFIFFLNPDKIEELLESLELVPTKLAATDQELLLEYITSVGLEDFIFQKCSKNQIKLICDHFQISTENKEKKSEEKKTEDENTEEEESENTPKEENGEKSEEKEILCLKNQLMDELTLNGFRSFIFEQSLALSREWVRDIGGPIAGAKQVIVERILSSILKISPDADYLLTEERSNYQNSIAARLRNKFIDTLNPNPISLSTGSTSLSISTISSKFPPKKKVNPASAAESHVSPTLKATPAPSKKKKEEKKPAKPTRPHPFAFIQTTDVNGKFRDPILKGISEKTLMVDYTHHELRKYCSFYRISQVGKKMELVTRILEFLNTFDYETPYVPPPDPPPSSAPSPSSSLPSPSLSSTPLPSSSDPSDPSSSPLLPPLSHDLPLAPKPSPSPSPSVTLLSDPSPSNLSQKLPPAPNAPPPPSTLVASLSPSAPSPANSLSNSSSGSTIKLISINSPSIPPVSQATPFSISMNHPSSNPSTNPSTNSAPSPVPVLAPSLPSVPFRAPTNLFAQNSSPLPPPSGPTPLPPPTTPTGITLQSLPPSISYKPNSQPLAPSVPLVPNPDASSLASASPIDNPPSQSIPIVPIHTIPIVKNAQTAFPLPCLDLNSSSPIQPPNKKRKHSISLNTDEQLSDTAETPVKKQKLEEVEESQSSLQ